MGIKSKCRLFRGKGKIWEIDFAGLSNPGTRAGSPSRPKWRRLESTEFWTCRIFLLSLKIVKNRENGLFAWFAIISFVCQVSASLFCFFYYKFCSLFLCNQLRKKYVLKKLFYIENLFLGKMMLFWIILNILSVGSGEFWRKLPTFLAGICRTCWRKCFFFSMANQPDYL